MTCGWKRRTQQRKNVSRLLGKHRLINNRWILRLCPNIPISQYPNIPISQIAFTVFVYWTIAQWEAATKISVSRVEWTTPGTRVRNPDGRASVCLFCSGRSSDIWSVCPSMLRDKSTGNEKWIVSCVCYVLRKSQTRLSVAKPVLSFLLLHWYVCVSTDSWTTFTTGKKFKLALKTIRHLPDMKLVTFSGIILYPHETFLSLMEITDRVSIRVVNSTREIFKKYIRKLKDMWKLKKLKKLKEIFEYVLWGISPGLSGL